jgi:hypothetical protein
LIYVEPGETGKRTEGVVMKKKGRTIVRRLGPVGLSVAAAAITAAGFAAISLAAKEENGDRSNGDRSNGEAGARVMIHPPGGPLENLSDEDRQKLEDFRQCMSEHGAEPPGPPRFDSDNPPEPPSRAELEKIRPSREEMERIRKAHEACKDKLPEDLQDMPGPIGGLHCEAGGPPPARSEDGENPEQGFVVPAPAPRGSSS